MLGIEASKFCRLLTTIIIIIIIIIIIFRIITRQLLLLLLLMLLLLSPVHTQYLHYMCGTTMFIRHIIFVTTL